MGKGACSVSLLMAFVNSINLEVRSLTKREDGKEVLDSREERKHKVKASESKWTRKYNCLAILRAHLVIDLREMS